MQMRMMTVPVFVFWTGILLLVMANIAFYSILQEVNNKQLPGEQFGIFFVNVKHFKVIRLHKLLFPTSGKRTTMWILAGSGLALALGSSFFFT
jgi:hypothetical protein